MLPTYHALLQPDGHLQFVDLPAELLRRPQQVLVTFTEEPPAATATATATAAPAADWQAFVGALKGSPHWNGDPQAVQEAMRREWD